MKIPNMKKLVTDDNLEEVADDIIRVVKTIFPAFREADDEYWEKVINPWIDKFIQDNFIAGEHLDDLNDIIAINLE